MTAFEMRNSDWSSDVCSSDLQQFEVSNPAIAKDATWLPDIAEVFDPSTSLFDLVTAYCERNPGTSKDTIFRSIELLSGITSNQIGLIEQSEESSVGKECGRTSRARWASQH